MRSRVAFGLIAAASVLTAARVAPCWAQGAAATSAAPPASIAAEPLIERIRGATLVVPDVERTARWYQRWLGYRLRERGRVTPELARSWGAARMAGQRFRVLSPDGSPDVFLRIVESVAGTPPPSARPAYGWGSLEIIVADVEALRERFRAGGIEVFREPASLGAPFETIHAMQARGPHGQTLNLTVDKRADPAQSNLPSARSFVDRIFLVGLNGPEIAPLRAFYVERLGLRGFASYDQPIPSIAAALGLPSTYVFPMTLARAAQKGNTIELHGLPPPTAARTAPSGALPAGVAIVSFETRLPLSELGLDWLGEPYASGTGRRGPAVVLRATALGPAGERLEFLAPATRGEGRQSAK